MATFHYGASHLVLFLLKLFCIIVMTYFLLTGNKQNVTRNSKCVGRYTFISFIASAVCYRNPLRAGRYLGIMTTRKQFLQLCEVEVYSRG